MKIFHPAVLALAMSAVASPSHAAIASGATGNGELFLSIVDDINKVSYAYDIGIRMDDFFKTGQPDGGTQFFRPITDSLFSAFLGLVNPAANLQWSVLAVDSTGNNNPASQRLFTTVRQGDEANLALWSNANLSTSIGPAAIGPFTDSLNSVRFGASGQSTHTTTNQTDYGRNGTSYVQLSDADYSNAYFGKHLTGNFKGGPFTTTNAVGQSSWFYYLTRSGSTGTDMVLIDEFDNGDGINAASGHDGYWGFTLVPASDTSSPYAGQYLLSYTLAPRVFSFVAPTVQQREFAASIGRTEITGGVWVDRLAGAAAAAALENSAGWVTVLGAAGGAGALGDAGLPSLLSPVPEPGSAVLLLAGAGLLWAGRRAGRAAKAAGAR